MQYLDDTTLDEIADKSVGVIIRSNTDLMDTINAHTFVSEGNLFIDCLPSLRRKYIVAVPDDATIARAQTPNPPWKFAIFVHPKSDAGRFVKSLLDAKIIASN